MVTNEFGWHIINSQKHIVQIAEESVNYEQKRFLSATCVHFKITKCDKRLYFKN